MFNMTIPRGLDRLSECGLQVPAVLPSTGEGAARDRASWVFRPFNLALGFAKYLKADVGALVAGLRCVRNPIAIGWRVGAIIVTALNGQIVLIAGRQRPDFEVCVGRELQLNSSSAVIRVARKIWIQAPRSHVVPQTIETWALSVFPWHSLIVLPFVVYTASGTIKQM